jgi:hypothetical protein
LWLTKVRLPQSLAYTLAAIYILIHPGVFLLFLGHVYHVIDEKSPFYELSIDELQKMNAEIIILVSGNDDTFNQLVHSRFSYSVGDIVLDADFQDMLVRDELGHITVLVDQIS